MDRIEKILQKENLSIEDLIACFEIVKENGDVAVIKFDGERNENQYTVFISFPLFPQKSMIRTDGNDLKMALVKVLDEYMAQDV